MGQAGGWLRTRVFLGALFLIGAFLPGCAKDPLITAATKDEKESDEVSSADDPVLQDVKKHNADTHGGRVTRWDGGYVAVHDTVGVPDLQGIVNDWNGALGGKLTLVFGGSGAPIVIMVDDGVACGIADTRISNYKTESSRIKLNSRCARNRDVVKHELGHAVGFLEHATDGGVMEAVTKNGVITDLYARTLRKLYDLKPGTKIT